MQNLFKHYLPQGEHLEKIFITKKFIQYKTLRTLHIDVFKIPDNKNTGKLFSKY